MPEQITISPRRVLHDEIAAAIRAMIVQGQLRPGARVPEQTLCVRFGVSRTPLREALKVLSAEGLVRLLPNRGAVVERLTRKEVEDMISVLGALVALAGELACARIKDDHVAHMASLHERMVEHFRRGEAEPYLELNRAFHRAILEVADNGALLSLHGMIDRRLRGLLPIAQRPAPRWDEAVADHERMMKALQSRDGSTLALVAREHLRHQADMAKEALDKLDKLEQRGSDRRRTFEASAVDP
jgi:DNA-binding GntR family transcriptional regulator